MVLFANSALGQSDMTVSVSLGNPI